MRIRAIRVLLTTVLLSAVACNSGGTPAASPSSSETIAATEVSAGSAPPTSLAHTWDLTIVVDATQTVPNNHCESQWRVHLLVSTDQNGAARGHGIGAPAGAIDCTKGFVGAGATEVDFQVHGSGTATSLQFTLTATAADGFMAGFELLFLPQGDPPTFRVPHDPDGSTGHASFSLAHAGTFEGADTSATVDGAIFIDCNDC